MQDEKKVETASVEPEEQKVVSETPESNWQYNSAGDSSEGVDSFAPTQVDLIQWSASEFIAHDKGQMWYVWLALAVIGIAGLVFLFDGNKGWFSPLMILIAGGSFAFYANRKPEVLEYTVSSSGVQVGKKLYNYSDFRSFAVIEEGAIDSIMLIPIQRFMPSLSIYFEPKDEQKIVEAIGNFLPLEQRSQDPIDRLMRKIRF